MGPEAKLVCSTVLYIYQVSNQSVKMYILVLLLFLHLCSAELVSYPEVDGKEISIRHNHTVGTPTGKVVVSDLEAAWIRLEHVSDANYVPVHHWRYNEQNTEWTKTTISGTDLLFTLGWHEAAIEMKGGLMLVTSPAYKSSVWHAFFYRRNDATGEYALEDHITETDSTYSMGRKVSIVGSNSVYIGGNNTVTQYVNSGSGIWVKLSIDLVRTDSFTDLVSFCTLSDNHVLLLHSQPEPGLSLYRQSVGNYELRSIYTDSQNVGLTDLSCNDQVAVFSNDTEGEYGVVNIFNVSNNQIQFVEKRDPDVFPSVGMQYGHAVDVTKNTIAVAAPNYGQSGGVVSIYKVDDNVVTLETYVVDPDVLEHQNDEVVKFGSHVGICRDGHTMAVLGAEWENDLGNVTTQLYLYADSSFTVAPTGIPTVSPTKFPTMSPTTGVPTNSPTKFPTGSPSRFPTTGAPTGTPIAPTITYDPTRTYQEPTISDVEVTFISLGISVAVLATQTWVIVISMSSFRIQHTRLKM